MVLHGVGDCKGWGVTRVGGIATPAQLRATLLDIYDGFQEHVGLLNHAWFGVPCLHKVKRFLCVPQCMHAYLLGSLWMSIWKVWLPILSKKVYLQLNKPRVMHDLGSNECICTTTRKWYCHGQAQKSHQTLKNHRPCAK